MSIHIIHGNDDYLVNRRANELLNRHVSLPLATFNVTSYPAGPESIENGCIDLMTPPVSDGERVVYLPETSWLAAMDEGLWSRIKGAVAGMSDRHVLLLTSPKLDNRLKSVKYLKSVATEMIECPTLNPWDTKGMTARVKEIATDLEVKLSPMAVTALTEAIGDDTAAIYNEIEKLSIYRDGERVEAGDVRELVTGSTVTAIELAKAILSGDAGAAIEIYRRLSGSPLPIVASLITQLRRYFHVKMMVSEGLTNEKIAATLGLGNPGRVYYMEREVSGVSVTRLKSIVATLLEAEIEVKKGARLDEFILAMSLK
jgi:DNA polymerase III subunit delta